MPANDDHQGAAPQRDFLLLTPAAEDRDLNATPNFDALVAMSRKASQTAHPAVLSFRKAETDSPGFSQQGDTDWVLEVQRGRYSDRHYCGGHGRRLAAAKTVIARNIISA